MKLDEIKRLAEKNIAESKVLIQPEKSWIRDQENILKLVQLVEKLSELIDAEYNEEADRAWKEAGIE